MEIDPNNQELLAIREELNKKAKTWYGDNHGAARQERNATKSNTKTTISAALKKHWGGELRPITGLGKRRAGAKYELIWIDDVGPEPRPPT